MKKVFFILFCFIVCIVRGQNTKTIKTTIVDFTKSPIENVSAFVYTTTDSSFITTQLSNKKGQISLTLEANQKYYCIIKIDSFAQKIFDIDFVTSKLPDTIILDRVFRSAEAATVYASPIVIKEDTIQFNNDLFKKDSVKSLEEVLKKFPGVTIDREGNIEINGIKVSEMLLEGKPLPYNDLKQLTQTLQASEIDKIQFIDRKTEESKISKIDNGQRDKVINIKLKSKQKKSINQDYYIGVGNNQRVESRGSINYLYNEFYSNANVNYNNTGRSNYGTINFFNPNGISNGLNANIGMRFTGFKKWTLGTNLSFGNQQNIFEEVRDRVIFLKDSLNFYQQNLNSTNRNKSFNVNNNITFTPDTLGEWRITLGTIFNNSKNTRNELFNTANNNKTLINDGSRNNNGDNNRLGFNLSLNGGRRTRNNKFSFYSNLNMSFNENEDLTFQENDIIFFRTSGNSFDTTKQKINTQNKNFNFRGNINIYKSIYKKLRLSLGAGLNYSNRPTIRQAYLYNYTNLLYEIPNNVLNNDVINQTNIFTQSIGLNYSYKKHTLSSTLNFNQQINKNIDQIRDTTFLQNNTFLTPTFNYSYVDKKFTINNSTSVSQRNPTTQQLQPIIDNTNPLFIRKGNPDLQNEQTFSINTTIQKKQTKKTKSGSSFNINNTITFTKNKIANNTFFDNSAGKQTSIPINLPDVFITNTNFSINQYFEKIKLNITSGVQVSFSKDNNFLNGELNKLTNFSIRPRLGAKLNRKLYYIDYAVGYLYQTNQYSLRPTQNIKIGNFTTDASIALLFIKNWEFSLDYQQTVNNNQRSLQRINNLNGRISFTPKWKKGKTTFSVQAFDLLNQNTNLRQNINDYYEEFVNTNAIRRFFLFTIQVKLNKFKAGKTKK